MEVINVMLVFEPDDHTALKSVIISDRPSTVYPSTVHVIARLRDSCYFQSLFSPDPPPPTILAILLSPGNCYNEQGNDRFKPPACLAFCLKNLRSQRDRSFATIRPIYFTFTNIILLSLPPLSTNL